MNCKKYKCAEYIFFRVFYEDKKRPVLTNVIIITRPECAVVSRSHASPCFLTLCNVIKENRTMPVSTGALIQLSDVPALITVELA